VVSSARIDIVQDTGDVVDSNCILECYHEYIRVISQRTSDALSLYRSYEHSIEIKAGEELPWGPIYGLSKTEMAVVHKYLEEISWPGKIRLFKSPTGAPIIFVPKAYGRG
jgi:hypothetical protein